jgi:copper chaperone CopZ
LVLLLGGAALAKDVTAEIKVKGMSCGSCAAAVKYALIKTKGVKKADVSVEKALAVVVYDDAQVTERELRRAIDKTGFKTEPAPNEKQ